MTKHRDLFAALAAPFAAGEVKERPQGNRRLSYVTARTVMNRLDAAVGPENWWDDYVPLEKSVICRLSLRLPDGQVLTKCDAGGFAGLDDAGDDEKSGFSDAFKRTAVKFGVGRYLYRDGVATLTDATPPPPTIAAEEPSATAPASKKSKPEIQTGKQLHDWITSQTIDPELHTWVIRHFASWPTRLAAWSQAQVAEAQPKIRARLEEVRAKSKGDAA